MGSNTLLMPFIDDSESFTLGFEAGQIWTLASNGETVSDYLIHTDNVEQIELIMEAFGCNYNVREASEDWSYLDILPTIFK